MYWFLWTSCSTTQTYLCNCTTVWITLTALLSYRYSILWLITQYLNQTSCSNDMVQMLPQQKWIKCCLRKYNVRTYNNIILLVSKPALGTDWLHYLYACSSWGTSSVTCQFHNTTNVVSICGMKSILALHTKYPRFYSQSWPCKCMGSEAWDMHGHGQATNKIGSGPEIVVSCNWIHLLHLQQCYMYTI